MRDEEGQRHKHCECQRKAGEKQVRIFSHHVVELDCKNSKNNIFISLNLLLSISLRD